MSNNVFPEITCLDGRWFLRYWHNHEIESAIELPNYPIMNRIYEASRYLLDVCIDDCGDNLYRCEYILRNASTAFAGISQLLADKAKRTQEEIDLEDLLYAPSDDEPWWNK